MRVVTWNCNGALRKKTVEIDTLCPDILVVQECEDPTRSDANYLSWAGNHVWTGSTKNKGIGIFARNGLKIEQLAWPAENYKMFLPARIDDRINIVAVWTQPATPTAESYIGQFWRYLQLQKAALTAETIVCGDFNSSAIWDKPRRKWNHSDCVRELAEIGFWSAYHHEKGEMQGRESQPTFYLHRNTAKPFHIDYVFAHHAALGSDTAQLKVGDVAQWLELSDHMPIVFDF